MTKLIVKDITLENVEEEGFFCYMSKRKTEGYRKKLAWVKARLNEGMRIKVALKDSRSFIEYIPGEHCWRAINADGYIAVHCLWVVGKKRHGQGHGTFMLNECVKDAKKSGRKGVVTVSSSRIWLHHKELFEKNGFKSVASEGPFDLMVKKFGKHPDPTFAGDWGKKAKKFGEGFTVLRTDQCPYIEDATKTMVDEADKRGYKCKVVEIKDRKSLMENSPYPYGTFAIILNGKPFAYHYILPKDLDKMLR